MGSYTFGEWLQRYATSKIAQWRHIWGEIYSGVQKGVPIDPIEPFHSLYGMSMTHSQWKPPETSVITHCFRENFWGAMQYQRRSRKMIIHFAQLYPLWSGECTTIESVVPQSPSGSNASKKVHKMADKKNRLARGRRWRTLKYQMCFASLHNKCFACFTYFFFPRKRI